MRARVIAVLALALFGAATPWIPLIGDWEERTTDARFQLRGPLPEGKRVVVVAVDDATEGAWRGIPKAMWSGELAKVVTKLDEAGASLIALDFVVAADPDQYLSSKGIDETPNSDLDRAIVESQGRTLLGTSRQGDVAPPLDDPTRLVSVNRSTAESGVVRLVPRFDPSFPTPLIGIAAALAGEVGGRADPIEINYSGRPPTIVSVRDLLDGRFDPALLRGAHVIVGETYAGSADLHQTPFADQVSGVVIHSEAARTLLDGNELRIMPPWVVSILTAIVTLLFGFAATKLWVGRFYLLAVAFILVWATACYLAFVRIHAVWPLVSVSLMVLALVPGTVYAVRALEEHRKRLKARAQWGQMIGESSLLRLEANREAGLGAWGDFDCCLLSLDIADFTSLSKQYGKARAELVSDLNKLFPVVVDVIERSGGEVLNFMGDGLAAKWEIEGSDAVPNRAKVLAAAMEVLRAVDGLDATRAFGAARWDVRIGLASGEATLALVGSESRKQMTLYGDAVNLAARLEAAGKDEAIRSRLVVSDDYASAIRDVGASFDTVGFQPKGWDRPLKVWRLLEPARVTSAGAPVADPVRTM